MGGRRGCHRQRHQAATRALVLAGDRRIRGARQHPPMLDERFASLLQCAAPAVLTTYRRDGAALVSPVWFRPHAGTLEVVIAEGDVKLKHLRRRPECSLTVFEAVAPFRGLQTRGAPELVIGDVTAARLAIASRYLGVEAGRRFAAQRQPNGTLVRLGLAGARTWDLAGILPTD
jgi:hypothetical protein